MGIENARDSWIRESELEAEIEQLRTTIAGLVAAGERLANEVDNYYQSENTEWCSGFGKLAEAMQAAINQSKHRT
jgi:hypothetical protein